LVGEPSVDSPSFSSSRQPGGSFLSFRSGLLVLVLLLLVPSCGDDGPTGLDTSNLEILLVEGDRQASQPGDILPSALKVRVQTKGNGAAVEGAKVRWQIFEGVGATVDPTVVDTDSLGMAVAQLTLGVALGTYRVQASVRGMESSPVDFSAEAILVPGLDHVPAQPVQAGDTILLQGSNFGLLPDKNVVTFSGVRGRVISSSPTELRVEVPGCLLARGYQLRVRIGALTTDPADLMVAGGGSSLLLDRGEDLVLDASRGFNCFHLPSAPGSLYLAVPLSTSTLGGTDHGFSLVGLTADGLFPAPSVPAPVPAREWGLVPFLGSGFTMEGVLDAQDRWDEGLRSLEAELLTSAAPLSPPSQLLKTGQPAEVSPLPELGEKRTFKVLKVDGGFARVAARVRYVSDHALVYVDEKVPSGGFTEQDISDLAREFEEPVYPTITGAYGAESDLDDNDRVIILFTAAVNRLTPPGSDGFVGGFFFGLDLMEGRAGSNEGEIFYAMVPDPAGEEGPAIGRYTALTTIPAVLAHEFEHMVHFNQRMLLKGAESSEGLWLSEALAQMAEDLVGEVFDRARQPSKAYQYRVGNWIRARRFLEGPSQVSVLASLPPGTLAERGAGWLLLKQLSGRPDQEGLLGTLASSTWTGTANLTRAMGQGWEELAADWAGALFLDGTGVPVRPELGVSGVNLREVLAESDGRYPLRPLTFGERSTLFSGTLWSSAPNYFIISPPAGGGVTLSATGPMGGLPEAAMGLRVLVVRLQ
ncbi:MAG: IPT/TIG domain-containing protein, partial [Longimicrobiales bacterium]|nr:IPT/TIG domain-containing protein [Longimicrobiales bacterium]